MVPGFTDEKKAKEIFSSPSGDGLVLDERNKKRSSTIFSSPLGDGLVLHYVLSQF